MTTTLRRVGILCSLFAVITLTGDVSAKTDDDTKAAIAAYRRVMKEGGERARIKAVKDLAAVRDKAAGVEIRKAVRSDRSERVRAAAARALGVRGDPKDLRWLSGTIRSFRKHPVALQGVLEGIGEYREPRTVKLLEDTACKWFAKHKYPVLASIRSLSQVRSKAAVEALLHLLERTYVRHGRMGPHGATQDGSVTGSAGGSGIVSDDTQAKVRDFRPYIERGLQRLTGEAFGDLDIWKEWWADNERTFDAASVKEDPNRHLKLTDDVFRYSIARPTEEWTWLEKADKGFTRTAVFKRDGRELGRLSILTYSTWEHEPVKASVLAAKLRESLERDVSLTTEKRLDETVEVCGVKAIRHHVTGCRERMVVTVEQKIFDHRGSMFVIETALPKGVFGRDKKALTKFAESFEFLE